MTRERVNDKRRRSRSQSRRRPDALKRQPIRRNWFAEEYDPIQIGSVDGTDTIPHDKGLVRALNSCYDANKDPQVQGDPYTTLFVARLNFDTTEETLCDFFNNYGAIRRLRLVRDKQTNQSKGYAFVEFEREKDFEQAYKHAHQRVIDGSVILVDFERSRVMKSWKPRRLGGGLGGKKKSGQLRFGGRDRPFRPPLGQHRAQCTSFGRM